jgi:tRNA(Ile)-lysidine synthase
VASPKQASPASEQVERVRRELDALVRPEATIGVAVSGGPDSLALLILAAAARPLQVEAATVDHALRPESRAEAEMVAAVCERLGVPHAILTATWKEKPETAIQERARLMRYRLLWQWASERDLTALLTAHHLEDQAETFLMRLARGAGVKGLAGMRRISWSPAGEIPVLRPLLGWSHAELEGVCANSGIDPVQDPSNEDEQFERVRVRKALAGADWLNPAAIAESAGHLAEADGALHWATDLEWNRAVKESGDEILYTPTDAPREIRRRIIRRTILKLATEGGGAEPRGRELDQLLAAMASGKRATLRGVLCVGGKEWQFTRAPERRETQQSAEMGSVEG